METINISKLGEVITEYRNGKPFSSKIEPMIACLLIAEKVNELIDVVNELEKIRQDNYDRLIRSVQV